MCSTGGVPAENPLFGSRTVRRIGQYRDRSMTDVFDSSLSSSLRVTEDTGPCAASCLRRRAKNGMQNIVKILQAVENNLYADTDQDERRQTDNNAGT